MYTERIPERDAEKARWALARGQWVVRVLANDVFWDRNGWRAWLRRAIDEARAGRGDDGRGAARAHARRARVPLARERVHRRLWCTGDAAHRHTDTHTHTHTPAARYPAAHGLRSSRA